MDEHFEHGQQAKNAIEWLRGRSKGRKGPSGPLDFSDDCDQNE